MQIIQERGLKDKLPHVRRAVIEGLGELTEATEKESTEQLKLVCD